MVSGLMVKHKSTPVNGKDSDPIACTIYPYIYLY